MLFYHDHPNTRKGQVPGPNPLDNPTGTTLQHYTLSENMDDTPYGNSPMRTQMAPIPKYVG